MSDRESDKFGCLIVTFLVFLICTIFFMSLNSLSFNNILDSFLFGYILGTIYSTFKRSHTSSLDSGDFMENLIAASIWPIQFSGILFMLHENKKSYTRGFQSKKNNHSEHDNPYPYDSRKSRFWEKGFEDCQNKKAPRWWR